MVETKPPYRAYAVKREGQKLRLLEIGVASMHHDGRGCDLHIDRLPVGGFSGHIRVLPNDMRPVDVEKSLGYSELEEGREQNVLPSGRNSSGT